MKVAGVALGNPDAGRISVVCHASLRAQAAIAEARAYRSPMRGLSAGAYPELVGFRWHAPRARMKGSSLGNRAHKSSS